MTALALPQVAGFNPILGGWFYLIADSHGRCLGYGVQARHLTTSRVSVAGG
jgi:hypothetical protein